jgi:hypothetical protein
MGFSLIRNDARPDDGLNKKAETSNHYKLLMALLDEVIFNK